MGAGREPVDVHSLSWLWFKLLSSTTIDSMVLLSNDEVLSAISKYSGPSSSGLHNLMLQDSTTRTAALFNFFFLKMSGMITVI